MSGYGVMKWPDGKVYEGEFMNDLKHGKGRLVTQDGKVYEGTWVAGKFGNLDTNDGEQNQGIGDNIAKEILQG